MIFGSLAAGGTLGVLIPPSILMIVYGTLADISVGQLFVAAIIPGLILAGLMSLAIMLISIFLAKPRVADQQISFRKKVRSLTDIAPTLLVFVVIMGSIYGGLATPTEAAALGILCGLVLVAINGRLSVSMLHQAFAGAFRTTSMIILIIAAAFVLNFVIALLGLPQAASQAISDAGLTPYQLIWFLVLFYLILGCFLEAVAMMVTTIGIVVPIVVASGFDPLWFGIFMTTMMELSLITPPVGLNLYVIHNLRPRGANINDVFIGVIPFMAAFFAFITLIIYAPEVVLWLPSLMQ
jgi:tripartite ATP-independent transporter DctM subunit